MSEIDERLREILILGDRDVLPANYDQQIEAIHTAFGEAGYLKFPQDIQESRLMDAQTVRLTGAEWHQAFMAELNKLKFIDEITNLDEAMTYIRDLKQGVEVAARRAAGLDT